MCKSPYGGRDEPAKRVLESLKTTGGGGRRKRIPGKANEVSGLKMEGSASSPDTGSFSLMQMEQHGQIGSRCERIQTWTPFCFVLFCF